MSYLPEEVLQRIFSSLQLPLEETEALELRIEPSISKTQMLNEKTLASLCRVSKAFRRLAEPILYSVLLVYTNTQDALLLRTLSQRPELGRLVRYLDIDGDGESGPVVQDAFHTACEWIDIPSDLKNLIAKAVQSDEDSYAGYIAFFASMLPSLQILHITMPYTNDVLVDLLHAFATGVTVTRFPKLRKLGLRHCDTEYAVNMDAVEDLLALPSLETFCGFSVDWCGPPETLRPLELKHISLENSLIDSQGLFSLLSRCKRAQTLLIYWGNACVGDCDLDWEEIGDALRLHGRLLERLDLDPLDAFSYQYEGSSGTIGSLEQLTKLKELKLPLGIFLGTGNNYEGGQDGLVSGSGNISSDLAALLPSSLESLHIYSFENEPTVSEGQLCSLIKSPRLLNLREIRITKPGPISPQGYIVKISAGEVVVIKL